MAQVRLGNLVSFLRHLPEDWVLANYAPLEEYIFPDHKHVETDKEQPFEYISATRPRVREKLSKYFGLDYNLELGDYENKLMGLLISAKEPVICIVGPMGSGKTSTIRYIIDTLEAIPCHECRKTSGCPHRRYIRINFNREDYPHQENKARNALAIDLSLRIEQAIRDTKAIDEEEELTSFWNEMFSTLAKAQYIYGSIVFLRHLVEGDKNIPDIQSIKDSQDLAARKQHKNIFLQDAEKSLEYHLLLWRYVLEKKFNNRQEKLILFLDNIDSSHPAVQTALVQLFIKHAIKSGVKCVITVRPETLESSNLTKASEFLEIENQEGPKPYQVVEYHLNKFIKNSEQFRNIVPTIEDADYLRLVDYLKYIQNINQNRRSRQYQKLDSFFNQVCGSSIRLGIKLADGLIKIDDELFSSWKGEKLTLYHVIRGLIRRGREQFTESGIEKYYHPIENLFDVTGTDESGKYFVKIRILHLLRNQGNEGASVSDIRVALQRFGYSETELIRLALNDLLNVQRQLIRSTNMDGFKTPQEFIESNDTNIKITNIGVGYLQLMSNLDYLQEVMFDCKVPTASMPAHMEIKGTYERLILISRFMEVLIREDLEELRNYISWPDGIIEYAKIFGAEPISWQILTNIYPSIARIVESELRKSTTSIVAKEGYNDAIGRFNSLLRETRKDVYSQFSITLDFPIEYQSYNSE